uniref:Interleukin-20 receptor subunit alpha-like n=1 Tax=Geotrypetes seraphini TaxID=260995 RepID=A0A6P8QG42_GEOSA|nr:interleukin-20 receptor subunit alpha-like [Geotrypetes seraphini]
MISALLLLYLCNYGSTSQISLPTQIKNLKLYSINLRTVLQWDPLNSTVAVYFVQFQLHGDLMWQNKTDCWGMNLTFCELTPEFSNPENAYEYHFARVQAETAGGLSNWTETNAFHPIIHTNIDPPELELTPQLDGISVHIIAPVDMLRAKFGMSQSGYKASKKKIKYTIILSSRTEPKKIYEADESVWNISSLTPGNQYCISATIELAHIKKESQPSKEQCITLQGNLMKKIILGSVVPAVAILLVACLFRIYCKLNKYASHPKMQLPSVLNLPGPESKKDGSFKDKEIVFIPSSYETMEIVKYILEEKLNNCITEVWNSRYVSTVQQKKGYTNEECRGTEGNSELTNLTYAMCIDEINHTSELASHGTSSASKHEFPFIAKLENAMLYVNQDKSTEWNSRRLPGMNENHAYINHSITEDPFQGKWGLCIQGEKGLQESHCATSVSYAGLSSTFQ